MLFQCCRWYFGILLQEWQNSIQKNAGLAFIELVNEGRWVTLTRYVLSSLLHYLTNRYPPATFQFHHSCITSQPLKPPRTFSSQDPWGPCDRVAIQAPGQQSMNGGVVRRDWERMDGPWVQSSIRYELIPQGFGERREVKGDRGPDRWYLGDA